MADFGYDVSEYVGIDPCFGTMADFDTLLAAAHARGLKLILHFVPNRSSDRRPWFEASRSSKDDSKRDWYIWHDGAPDGGPPNNWLSHFGGSAWQWDPSTRQYYLHSFLREQPDLNWRNPAVKMAMYDVLRSLSTCVHFRAPHGAHSNRRRQINIPLHIERLRLAWHRRGAADIPARRTDPTHIQHNPIEASGVECQTSTGTAA